MVVLAGGGRYDCGNPPIYKNYINLSDGSDHLGSRATLYIKILKNIEIKKQI